ncbi:hypothetical protein MIR68_003660 [Amoeboaphelidium protococcarum]|nr:hypothetical protein MIR68_003660 [Amoeboaphelidium protococcarum]
MDGLQQLALLPNSVFAQCLSPVDLLELSLTCRDLQKFVQSRKARYFIRKVYFSYYGPGLTMLRIWKHAYLGIRVAKEFMYFLSPQATQSKAFARLFKQYQSNDFAKCSKLFRQLGKLIVDHLGDEVLSRVKSTYYYHDAVDDEILCMSDKAYVKMYSQLFMDGRKITVSVQSPRWKVLDYRYFNEMLSRHNCHQLYFDLDYWYYCQRMLVQFERFFGTRMSESDLSRFLFQFLIHTGQQHMHDAGDELRGSIQDLIQLDYDVRPVLNEEIIKFVRILLDCDGVHPLLSTGEQHQSAYEYLMSDDCYNFDVERRLGIDNSVDDSEQFDKSVRVQLSEYITENLPSSSASQLCGALFEFARKFPLNGERAALILAFLVHWQQLDSSCNLYYLLMAEAYDKPDDSEFCLLLYKLVRFCHIEEYQAPSRLIYHMFGHKAGYQQKLLATVERHIEPDNLWIFLQTVVRICGPLELESASRVFAKVLKSSSIDYRILDNLPDSAIRNEDEDIDDYFFKLELELHEITCWLGESSVVYHCLTNLNSDLSDHYQMDLLHECVSSICEHLPFEQQCEMTSSIAYHYRDSPQKVALFLQQIIHSQYFETTISVLEQRCTHESLKAICQVLGTRQQFITDYVHLFCKQNELEDVECLKLFGIVFSQK